MKRILNCVVRHLVGLEKEGEHARTKVCKHNLTLGRTVKINNSGMFGTHTPNSHRLTDYIYIYYICNESGLLILDRSVSRHGLGPSRANELVDGHQKRGRESFFTIGTLVKVEALS